MKLESLHDLYLSELKDLYSAEDQILKALPKMIEKAESPELRQALDKHLGETRGQVSRLERVFEMHGERAEKQKCKGMQGVLDEGSEMVEKDATPAVRDAAIISACQRVEHYEMAAYGAVRAFAEQLGHEKAAALLQQTLDEETKADRTLGTIAKKRVNTEAARTA